MNTINIKALSEEVQKLETKVKEAVELPSVETTDEGKVLTVDSEGHWAAENLPPYPVGNLDYSTTEQDTGVKWINGKEIYFKVYTGSISGENQLVDNIGAGYEIIDFRGSVYDNSGIMYDMDSRGAPHYNATSGNIALTVMTGFTSGSYKLIVYYTKPDPVPAEETKKVSKKKTTK